MDRRTQQSANDVPTFASSGRRGAQLRSAKQQFLDVFLGESATTRRVLRAIPEAGAEFRPHPSARTAREVAAVFSLGQGAIAAALTSNWRWPADARPAPPTLAEAIVDFEATNQAVLQALANVPDARLFDVVPFFTGPRQMGDIPVVELMWFMLMDSIHHRGQLSVYLRAMGAKVPSIYGPSGDEPWM